MEIKRLKWRVVSIVLLFLLVSSVFAKNSLLVIRSEGVDFEDAVKGLEFDLQYDFDIHQLVIKKDDSEEVIKTEMSKVSPDIVVLMNNVPINLYKKYQSSLGEQDKYVPTVAFMAILVEKSIAELKNSNAISFEIPLVTSAVSVRGTYGKDKIKKIGVVYRGIHDDYIAKNQAFCNNEGIELALFKVPDGSDSKMVASTKKGLKQLLKKDQVDAIWVPVDNGLLVPTLQTAWFPVLKSSKVPVIVGVKNFLKPGMPFANFGVLPDYVALGSQAASIVYDIMDNDWQVYEDGKAQPPLSVKTYLYMPDAAKNYGLKKENIMTVDEFLE